MTFIFLIILLSIAFLSNVAISGYSLEDLTMSLIKIKVANSESMMPDKNGILESEYSHGTGFYISNDGMILTAQHVIDKRSAFNSDPITCLDMTGDQPFGPIIIWEDKKNDVAILQHPNNLKKIKFFIDIFNQAGKIKKGSTCYCIGFPNEVQNFYKIVSFSVGTIILENTNLPGHEKVHYRKNTVVSSCDVVPGFSGGIIVDESFLPISMIIGSMKNNKQNASFSRRIRQLREIVDAHK